MGSKVYISKIYGQIYDRNNVKTQKRVPELSQGWRSLATTWGQIFQLKFER